MYWRFVLIMQHIPCPAPPGLITLRLVKWVSIMCHVTLATWHVTLSRALTWHDDTLPVMGEKSMRRVSPEQWGALIKTGRRVASSAYAYTAIHSSYLLDAAPILCSHNESMETGPYLGLGKFPWAQPPSRLSTDSRPRISWLMLKPFNFTFSLCDDLRNRLMSV